MSFLWISSRRSGPAYAVPPEIYRSRRGKGCARLRFHSPEDLARRGRSGAVRIFLSCMPGKELAILRFPSAGLSARTADDVSVVPHCCSADAGRAAESAERSPSAQGIPAFFSDYDGALAATITPKNYVLPFLKEHFCSRLMNETFLIFDRTHKAALVWQDRKARIISLNTLELPPATAEGCATASFGSDFTRPSPSLRGKPPLPHDALSQKILGKHAGDGG